MAQHTMDEEGSLLALIHQAVVAAVQGAMPKVIAQVTTLLGGGQGTPCPKLSGWDGVPPGPDQEPGAPPPGAHTVTSPSIYGEHLPEMER